MRTSFLAALVLSSRAAAGSGWSWTPSPASEGTAAPRVSGQAAASTADGGVLLFGGLTGPAGSPTTNDLWHFDSAKKAWKELRPAAASPRVRMYAASAALGKTFAIFGGWDPMAPGSGGEFLDDAWSFDLEEGTWKEEACKLPFPVSRHAAAAVGDTAVIVTFKGVFTFKDGILEERPTKGDGPGSLSMCAVTAMGDKVVVFGGSDKTQVMSSDVYVLDTDDWTWSKKERKGDDGPPAMASASMAPLDGSRCVVCGGAGLAPAGYEGGRGLLPCDDTWICTVGEEDVAWERVDCEERPEGRVAASLNRVGEDAFVLQGGFDPASKGTFGRSWILSKK